MPNRLAAETSPYLLQHADNPVDWYAWGEDAFAEAKRLDRPVLLSVGYSACHWCHVMAHESFEDPRIAALMNEAFVSVKVDREERPDVDAIYMQAVQALTGRGGWPMTVFLTPEGLPFFGGTYFPPEDRGGTPAFPRVLRAVAEAYRDKRGQVEAAGQQLLQSLSTTTHVRPGDQLLTESVLDQACEAMLANHDRDFGGFGRAPKFPAAMALDFLLRYYHRHKPALSRVEGRDSALEAVERSLQAMAHGGIYDQVGGGFHRYATDAVWLVPHFEKMLYDNALLARVYLDAWKVTGNPLYRRVVTETLDYVLREMTHPRGGFYSTQDADSEGEEGRFFLWTPPEIEAVLGADAEVIGRYYGVSEAGNFEGRNILHVAVPPERFLSENNVDPLSLRVRAGASPAEGFETFLAEARRKVYAAREQRVHPGRDEKVLTAWNGLMLRAFAEAAFAFDSQTYRDAAVRNADFLLSAIRPNGRLLRSWKDGVARLNGYLEDYACLIDGLLAVYQATFEARYLREAIARADEMIDLFWDEGVQGFFDTGRDHESLITRPRELFDNATPSGTSVAADVLLRLAVLTDNSDYERRASACLHALAPIIEQAATAFGRLLAALDFDLSPNQELAIVWPIAFPLPQGEGQARPERSRRGEGEPARAEPALSKAEGALEARSPASETVRAELVEARELLDAIRASYLPNLLLVGAPEGDPSTGSGRAAADLTPLLRDRPAIDGKPTAYVCERYVCQAPTTDPAELRRQLGL